MEFFINHSSYQRAKGVYLIEDNWDDFGYKNTYAMLYVDEHNKETKIGIIKLGEYGLEIGRSKIERKFKKLNDNQFSLGQSAEYYKNIKYLGDDVRKEILTSLNDIAYSNDIYLKAKDEEVTRRSLLRDIYDQTVIGQFRRIALGRADLTDYEFTYTIPNSLKENNVFEFEVLSESLPPTNIHAIIGTNGSGKTTALQGLLREYLEGNNQMEFTNAIFISFSIFDNTPVELDQFKDNNFSYVGIRKSDGSNKSYEELVNEFEKSLSNLLRRKRIQKVYELMEILNADVNLASYNIQNILANFTEFIGDKSKATEILKEMTKIFKLLSSGHQIVLLTIVRLVDLMVEKTLIIIDEPETHLHPPLLSAFIRAVSSIIIKENAVAILATHSPVVLQEIPKSCVSILSRHGDYAQVIKPKFETFGENIGILTEEVFKLEITSTGFHSLLKKQVLETPDYQEVLNMFDNQLSLEAKTIVRAYIDNLDGDNHV